MANTPSACSDNVTHGGKTARSADITTECGCQSFVQSTSYLLIHPQDEITEKQAQLATYDYVARTLKLTSNILLIKIYFITIIILVLHTRRDRCAYNKYVELLLLLLRSTGIKLVAMLNDV